MFTRLLIANRGEIACRVARTCRRLGIEVVAVYSDADACARHVREADIAVRIGAPPARDSYLNVEAIMKAAVEHGAQAIHPGYGFLSEKLELIDACAQAGIVFVGPHRNAIASMGSKIESKRIARGAGVSCVPGYDGDDQSDARLFDEGHRIGFPLLIKASAGGGGKGMKRVDDAPALARQIEAARREALAAFGDDKVLMERYIQRPRHLEVQLLGDRHGGLVHLFERECSIQRNYQKIIEEAPANHLPDAVRETLYGAATALGRSIGYDSTGTVEFVLDADDEDRPYFLEMNTRLQVEHPVTELTTGLDLVEQQIRSALGEPLTFRQQDIKRHGWAIEARINAEIPEEGFAASFGRVHGYHEPVIEGLRIDSGIDERSEITPHYDSMLAKAIAFGGTREVARRRLLEGVRSLRIEGVHTSQRMLDEILLHPSFAGVLTTRFLLDAFPQGWQPQPDVPEEQRSAAAASWVAGRMQPRSDLPLDRLVGFRLGSDANSKRLARYTVRVGPSASELQTIAVECVDAANLACHLDGASRTFVCCADGSVIAASGRRYQPSRTDAKELGLWCEGGYSAWTVVPDVATLADEGAASNGGRTVTADMPGVLSELLVKQGDRVAAGTPVAVIEAMKLFHTLEAPSEGIVETLPLASGATVNKGTILVTLTPLSE
ncbi:biotin carboxylase N-terminal domain-containing protein [Paraburkholderia sp. BL10I2N1]|uniref:acetyl/propionyl/methylcrotonyl-CoA carboxylase subunit alpha n=1 Tax=Paraburkholderia sp. BL10I2N1 TaxID=1938796 RepID=UPI00105FBDF0|nr:biotin carboxylase N-terminal domain-containing protein [Paraburkholderia sp. BL10I2N1]TDN61408.1 3-methylcrotonyl-CoA carboxylase alpha subunit [Paraburkholderia sp. BL10I2N1]